MSCFYFWRALPLPPRYYPPLLERALSLSHTVSHASFLTSRWRVPSFLVSPQVISSVPIPSPSRSQTCDWELKKKQLSIIGYPGSVDTIMEWYRLQIMHVSSLNLILFEGCGTVQGCTDVPRRPYMLNNIHAFTEQEHLLTSEAIKTCMSSALKNTISLNSTSVISSQNRTTNMAHLCASFHSIYWFTINVQPTEWR